MATTMPEQLELDPTPERIGELVALVDAAAADAKAGWHEVSSALKDNHKGVDIDALAVGFDYRMRERGEGGNGIVFTSSWTLGGTTYPMPLDKLPELVVQLWEKVVVTAVTAPVRARLHDLLFTLGRQPRHEHAERACIAYLQLANGSWIPLYRALALIRALDVSRQMNRGDLAQQTEKQMIANARECIDGADWQPGVSLRLLERLVAEKKPPVAVDDLLTLARSRYAADPYVAVDVAMLQRRRAKDDKELLGKIDREIVVIWSEAAEASSGLQRVGHLTKAIEYARSRGQQDLLAKGCRVLGFLLSFPRSRSVNGSVTLPFATTGAHAL